MKYALGMMALALGMASVGCNSVKGTLTVTGELPISLGKNKAATAAVGSYDAELTITDFAKELEVTIKGVNGKTDKIKLKLPKGAKLPTENGAITIAGKDTGQSFDVNGSLSTDVEESPTTSEIDSCEIPISHSWCHDYTDKNGQTQQACTTKITFIPGTHEVDSHEQTTTTTMAASFVDSASNAALATFSGQKVSYENVIDYEAPCSAD
jgi:hypothetical protein